MVVLFLDSNRLVRRYGMETGSAWGPGWAVPAANSHPGACREPGFIRLMPFHTARTVECSSEPATGCA